MNQVKVKGSAALFSNPILEKLTRANPMVIMGIYIPFCTWLLFYFHGNINPSFSSMGFIFLTGLLSWTFFEYILHRFIFHFVAEQEWAQRFHYIVHGVHHEYPKDKQRLIMPPLPSIIGGAVFFFLFKLVLGLFVYAFFSGFVTGYLFYALIHYSTHAFRPPKNRLKYLWKYHSYHHFKYPDKAFGVSSPVWDYVFGTLPPGE
jgi:4-hydroxysphinganine ceramide fatty acyl 2-hydroxylase